MNKKMTSFFIYFLCTLVLLSGFLFYPEKTSLQPPHLTPQPPLLNRRGGDELLSYLGEVGRGMDRRGGDVVGVGGEVRKADEILVKFKNSDKINVIKIAQPPSFAETTEGKGDFYEVLESYNDNPAVEYAEPNYLYRGSIIPSDTYYNNQWYLQKIKATETWNKIRESPDAVIAIIDSGVQINHPDLRDNIWRNTGEIAGNAIDDDKNGFIDDINGWDFVNNAADPNPKFEDGFTEDGILHGTVVAGVAAASGNNAAGIAGVTWKAQIMALKVLNDKGEGDTNKVIKAIDYAIQNGADIINLSFVGFGFSQALDNAIKRAYDAGIIIVAAAGNEQGEGEGYFLDEVPMYPACHDGSVGENRVIGVAATDTLDQKAAFSSYGFKCVDIAAPGISIYSTVVYSPTHYAGGKPFNKYYDGYWSGTSMAAPMVSGAVALIEQANPGFNRDQVISALLNNSDNINRLNPDYLNQLGNGRINIAKAVNYAKNKLVKKTANLLVAPYSNYVSLIRITDKDGRAEQEFFAYADNFLGGATVASGDIDGNGVEEIITGAGFGGGPHVRIFTAKGELKAQFFAYNPNFCGGVNVACGDVDGNGVDEIITGAGFGGGPHVKIFDIYGDVKGQFFAHNKNFRGGVNVACGDVDGDGKDEIVTGAGNTGGPHVRIFKANGQVQAQFFAYHPNFRGGVKVAVANIDGGTTNQQAEIITAPGQGGGPHIRIFDNNANIRGQFFAYNKNFHGGVNVAVADIDQDGIDEIITGAGPGGAPHVRVFKTNGLLIGSFYAYEAGFDGGVNVAAIEMEN